MRNFPCRKNFTVLMDYTRFSLLGLFNNCPVKVFCTRSSIRVGVSLEQAVSVKQESELLFSVHTIGCVFVRKNVTHNSIRSVLGKHVHSGYLCSPQSSFPSSLLSGYFLPYEFTFFSVAFARLRAGVGFNDFTVKSTGYIHSTVMVNDSDFIERAHLGAYRANAECLIKAN